MQVFINRNFLYKIRPERMILFAIIFWVACLVFSPIQPTDGLSLIPCIYITGCLLCFWMGSLCIKYKKSSNLKVEVSERQLNRIYRITFVLGALGVLFKYFDLFFLRDASFLFSDDGELEMEEGGNIFSMLSGMLIFFSYIPVTLDQLCPLLSKRTLNTASLVIFLMTGIVSAITGSRFAIILPFLYFVILMLYTGKFSFKLTKRNLLIIAAIVLLFGFIIGGLFITRLELVGGDAADRITDDYGYTRKVPIKKEFSNMMKEHEGTLFYTYLFAYTNIVQYEVHGVYEFPAVMEAIDKDGVFFYGQATLWVFMKFIYKVLGSNYNLTEDMMKHNPSPGIWSTFFFQWYLDFGWLGVILMFAMGYISKFIWNKVQRGGILYSSLFLRVNNMANGS